MDPQKLLLTDTRLITTIRVCGLVLSLGLAVVCLLIYAKVIDAKDVYYPACIPIAALLLSIGVLQAFWSPYTRQKVSVFSSAYLVVGILLSIFVTGFSTMIYLGWMILITVIVIYFGWYRALLAYFCMFGSLLAWLGLHLSHHHRGEILTTYLATLAVGGLLLIIGNLWRVTKSSIRELEAASTQQNYEHSQLTSLVNSMADGVIALDSDAKVLLYNAAALNVLDLNSSMKDKSVKKFLRIVDKEQQPVDVVKLVKGTKLATVSRDYRIAYGDGSFANLYLSIAPVHLGYGKAGSQGFVLMLRDITHEKSLEEERDEFISVVSHELRTPIAISEGNISNAQLIAERSGDMKAIRDSLEQAHSQVLFLADMINDLATLSRAERGKLVLEVEDIDVSALMRELATAYESDATAKGLELKSIIAKDLPILSSSKLYVREVLQNFITNAIKYTEKGSVTIVAKAEESGVLFEVKDTGIGISKSDQERVFDKFFRSEDYRTRQNSGTGLGLYVTMKLARLIHADIDVHSELNEGSTFSIHIPSLNDQA